MGAIGLACGDGAECGQESWVDGACVVEEGADDVLDVLDFGLVQATL